MKKFLALLITSIFISSFAFATISDDANATLVLDLKEVTSTVFIGFLTNEPTDIAVIEGKADNDTAVSISVGEGTNLASTATTFYVWWKVYAIKGAGGTELTLTAYPFISSPEEGEPNDEKLGYTLETGTAVYQGIRPSVTGDHEVTTSGDNDIQIFSNTTPGLSYGYVPFTIESINYSGVSAQRYAATLTLNITAP